MGIILPLRDYLAAVISRWLRTNVGKGNESTRVAWLRETLAQLPAGARLLDAGAGEQQFRRFCSHVDYVSQDIAEYDGQGDGSGLHTGSWDFGKLDHVCDISNIPEPDGSFDAIMCTEVLEHLPDPTLAIREFSRLLKPGGRLIITAPFCSLTHFAPYHYSTGFNRYYYEYHLPKNGFEIAELTVNGNYFEYVAQEIRRIPSAAAEYAADRPNRIERLASRIVLKMLERFSKAGSASGELLSYGIHVRAVRV